MDQRQSRGRGAKAATCTESDNRLLWLAVAAGASKADNIDEDDERIGDREECDA
jgi:hypothetical protein